MEIQSINEILDPETVVCGLAAESKDEVFRAMSELLFERGYVASADDFVKALYDREREGVTGVGSHVAIPHGKSATVKRSGVAIAVLDHEIAWESLDETGAKVVVMLTVEDHGEGANDHLRMLALFARKMARQEVVDALVTATTPDEVIAAFAD